MIRRGAGGGRYHAVSPGIGMASSQLPGPGPVVSISVCGARSGPVRGEARGGQAFGGGALRRRCAARRTAAARTAAAGVPAVVPAGAAQPAARLRQPGRAGGGRGNKHGAGRREGARRPGGSPGRVLGGGRGGGREAGAGGSGLAGRDRVRRDGAGLPRGPGSSAEAGPGHLGARADAGHPRRRPSPPVPSRRWPTCPSTPT